MTTLDQPSKVRTLSEIRLAEQEETVMATILKRGVKAKYKINESSGQAGSGTDKCEGGCPQASSSHDQSAGANKQRNRYHLAGVAKRSKWMPAQRLQQQMKRLAQRFAELDRADHARTLPQTA